MSQFSNDGKPIQMEVISGHLLFIDPAYFQEIAENIDEMKDIPRSDTQLFIREVENRVFPYGGGSLLGLRQLENGSGMYELDPVSLTRYSDEEPEGEMIEKKAAQKSITAFGVDSAAFLIIDLANFEALLPIMNFDDLFDLNDDKVSRYIDKINTDLGNRGWAFVSSPGIGKGFDFEGDGSYYLKD
jgi:hypothetical protein